MNFDKWFNELIEDEIWSSLASMQHKPDTFKTIANRVYMQCVADGNFKPISECRKHVYHIVCRTPGDKPKTKPWYEKELEKKILKDSEQEEWKPVSSEKRSEYLNQIQAILKETKIVNAMPPMSKKELLEQGDWIPKTKKYEPPSEVERIIILKESKNRIRECRRKVFLDAYPDATEEEIHAYWQKFEDTKDEAI